MALYLDGVRSFLEFCEAKQVSPFSGPSVEDWRDHLERRGETWRGKGGGPLSPQSVNTKLKGVKYASKWRAWRAASENRRDVIDFADYVETLKEEGLKRPPKIPDFDEVRRLLASLTGTSPAVLRDRAILTLGFRTGLRRAAIAAATKESLQLHEQRLTVTNKGGEEIHVPLDTNVLAALKPWLDWLVGQGVNNGSMFRSLSKTSWLKPLEPSGVYYVLRVRAKAAGIGRMHPHAMRHFYVTESRHRGMPDWQIALRTGHKPNRTGQYEMMDTYSHDDGKIFLPTF